MNITTDQVFEFGDLDTLWNRVKSLKHTDRLEARRPGQCAQGPINEIKADPRFDGFRTNVAKHTGPGAPYDLTSFTIYRDPRRWATRQAVKWTKGIDFIEIESPASVDHDEPVWIVTSNLTFDNLPVEFRATVPHSHEAASIKLFNLVSQWAERNDLALVV